MKYKVVAVFTSAVGRCCDHIRAFSTCSPARLQRLHPSAHAPLAKLAPSQKRWGEVQLCLSVDSCARSRAVSRSRRPSYDNPCPPGGCLHIRPPPPVASPEQQRHDDDDDDDDATGRGVRGGTWPALVSRSRRVSVASSPPRELLQVVEEGEG